MSLRERRLRADAEALERLVAASGTIRLLERQGDPPDRYKIEYQVPGLVLRDTGIERSSRHLVEIYLTLAYPRQAPQCRMLTPIFHPNIAPHAVCIGDHWSAGEPLAALAVRIAEMICYQSYNVKSPLNGEAARWAEEHLRELPLLKEDLGRGALPDAVAPAATGAPAVRSTAETAAVVAPGPPAGGDAEARAGATPRSLACPTCGSALRMPEGWSLTWIRCPMCARMIPISD